MRIVLLATLCMIISGVNAQDNNPYKSKYLIIDRKLKQPLQISDTITDEQLNRGYFAIEQKNADSIIGKLAYLSSKLRKVARYDFDETQWAIGLTVLKVKAVTLSFGDRLNVALSTNVGTGANKEFYIVDSKLTNNDNARYLNKLIKYIKKES
jgi:hypothetical protein